MRKMINFLFLFCILAGISFYLSQFEDKSQNLKIDAAGSSYAYKIEDIDESAEISKEYLDYVIDGDTISLKNGEKVRLLGIDTPEISECYYEEASKHLESLLIQSDLELTGDVLNEDRDKYGRLLRYVYVDGTLINRKMLEGGFAKYLGKYPIEKSEDFKKYESFAKKNNIGIWKNCPNF